MRSPASEADIGFSSGRHAVGGLACVVILAVACWLVAGVAVSEIIRWIAYQLVYVVGPGWLAYGALSSGATGPARRLALGWALGYAIEIGAFVAAGAVGLPAVAYAYPAVVLVLAGLRAWARPRRARESESASTRGAAGWTVAAVGAAAIALTAALLFTQTPLPGSVDAVDYDKDSVRRLSFAAEAKHHWPITDPSVAGHPLPYHYFPELHTAATSRVTGIELSTLLFRLDPIAEICLLILLVAVAGAALSGVAQAGAFAAGLLLLVGEPDLSLTSVSPFTGALMARAAFDPGWLLGAIFSVGALLPIAERRCRPRAGPLTLGTWAMVVVFLFAAGGSKPAALPVLIGGLVLVSLIDRWKSAHGARVAAIAALLATCVLTVFVFTLYGRGESAGGRLSVQPFSVLESMDSVELVRGFNDPSGQFAGLSHALSLVVGVVGLTSPIGVVLALLVLRRRCRLEPPWDLLLALYVVGLALSLGLGHPSGSQVYFYEFGSVSGAVLVAGLLHRLWTSATRPTRHRALRAGAAAAVLALCALAAGLYLGDAGAIAAPGTIASLSLAVLGLCAVTRLGNRPDLMATAMGAFVGGVVAICLLDAPLDILSMSTTGGTRPYTGSEVEEDEPLYSTENANLTPGILAGMRWIRDHTDPAAVLAVNNHYRDEDREDARYFYYSAFAERRVLLEAWRYWAVGASTDDQPFPGRAFLNEGLLRGDRRASRRAGERYGVTHIVIDKVHGERRPQRSRPATPVFSNADIDVYPIRSR